jgi:hypothetical protein
MFISLILIIFWSLVGAIPLLIGKLINGEDKPIFIIEKELFVISPDLNYLYALLSYILFISFILCFLWTIRPTLERRFQRLSKNAWGKFAENFSHLTLLIFNGIVAILLLFNLMAIELAAGDMPVYLTENRVPSRIVEYARVGIVFSTALGSILLVIGSVTKNLKKRVFAVSYICLFLMACYPFWISGTRNTLFLTLVGLIIGTATIKNFSNLTFSQILDQIKLVIALVLISFLCVSVTSTTRGLSLNSQTESSQVNTPAPSGEQKKSALIVKSSALLQALTTKSSYLDWLGRGEVLDSHASLYGVITKMDSKPRIKLENTYGRYAKIVGATGSKGYTINPVAALWMNIGILAPFVAGVYFSIVILFFWCISRVSPTRLWPIIALPSIALSSVGVPVILSRSGPEGLWGLFINVVFLPGLFLFLPTVLALKKTKG